jgi:hypothetical protein
MYFFLATRLLYPAEKSKVDDIKQTNEKTIKYNGSTWLQNLIIFAITRHSTKVDIYTKNMNPPTRTSTFI